MSRMQQRVSWFLIAVTLLTGCGSTYDYEKQQAYIDKCIIESGPQSAQNNVLEYCRAKWRQSQREK